jgi:hypothetical protein
MMAAMHTAPMIQAIAMPAIVPAGRFWEEVETESANGGIGDVVMEAEEEEATTGFLEIEVEGTRELLYGCEEVLTAVLSVVVGEVDVPAGGCDTLVGREDV